MKPIDARAAFEKARLPSHVRTAAATGALINAVFAVLDTIAYPEHLAAFMALRFALTLVCVGIWFLGAEIAPRLSKYAFCLAFGGAMISMIYLTGGPASNYFAGLILVLVGIGVLLPLTIREAVTICSVTVLPYAATPFLFRYGLDAREFAIQLTFVFSGAIECVWSSAFLDSLRMKDFYQRVEIEDARDHLREMDEVKARFSANVHHELRTPLTLMLVPIDAMIGGRFGEISPAVLDYLRTMRSNGQRLLKLINDLLDVAKIESRQLRLCRRPMDISDRVREVTSGAGPTAELKKISLSVLVEDELNVVNADPDAIDKILINLLGNALKFTPKGGTVTFDLKNDEETKGVHVVVSDTGIGIPREKLAQVFDRFAQVDNSATRQFEGTGIGLSLCLELVRLHNGDIWAESEGSGTGTDIHFVLPIGDADTAGWVGPGDSKTADADPKSTAESGEHLAVLSPALVNQNAEVRDTAGFDSTRHTVVLAEDNPDMRRLLTLLLSGEFDVRATENGQLALDAVREVRPLLVVTDAMMPVMSGTELCRQIKSDPDLRSIAVMLVTSRAERDLKIETLELGADDYVTKPFHPRELLARARSLVRLRLLSEEVQQRNVELVAALAELQEMQAQLVHREKMASLGQFVAGIAHELNNPINFLQGNLYQLRIFSESMSSAVAQYEQALDNPGVSVAVRETRETYRLDEVDEELSAVFAGCDEGLKRATALIRDLLTFSRADKPDPHPVDIVEGLESTLRVVASRIRNIEIVRSYHEIPPVECISGQINQIFVNLIVNASDAMDGQGRIILRTRALAPDGSDLPSMDAHPAVGVSVEVEDDGPGLDPVIADRIFEPFYTTKAEGERTGLGLSISYGIARRHGGDLSVRNGADRGAIFRLELPVRSER